MQIIKTQIDPDGPFITAIVGVSRPRQNAIEAEGGIVPSQQAVRLLIDTGASGTCIDKATLDALEVQSTGVVQMYSASSAPEWRAVYDISLWIPISPNLPPHMISRGISVMECSMAHHGFEGVLGRDVLAVCVLTYNGPEKVATLAM